MNDDSLIEMTDERVLAAMKAVNPPTEKLMAERRELRQEMRLTKAELDRVRLELIPRLIGIAKTISLSCAALALAALTLALFKGLFEVKTTTTLFASFLLPIWLVDQAEAKFGRWIINRNGRSEYIACRSN